MKMIRESSDLELCDIVYDRKRRIQDGHRKCDVLEICEFLLSRKLKSLCDDTGKEIDSKQSAEVLHGLGQVYWQRSPDKISLIRSAILYNVALMRNPENALKIATELHELCSHVLDLAGVKSTDANLTCIEKVVKNSINKFRESVKKQLDNIKFLHDSKVEQKEFQTGKISAMEKLQQDIYDWYCDLMNYIMDFCVSIKGNPPCEYALVGMGSLARKEITPYSDFEHIILLEEGVQERENYEEILEYFRWVSVIFHTIVINIGETIVPCAALPYLNNSWKEEYNWFYDEETKRGISFDGMFPHASKFPLGRSNNYGKPWKTELIKPVSEMLKYLSSDEKLKPGYHLADILTTTCFLSGNQYIFNDFQMGTKLKEVTSSSSSSLQEQLEEDIRKFNPVGNLSKASREEKWNIKQVVYRSTTLFISALGRYYGLHGNGSFDIIRKLLEKHCVEENFAHDLSYAVAIACHVRLSTYLENDRQEDWLESSKTKNEFSLQFARTMGEKNPVLYFQTALKLQRETCRIIGLIDSQFVQWSPQLDRLLACFWLHQYESASREAEKVYSDGRCSTEVVKTVNEILLTIGDTYFETKKFDQALPCFNRLLSRLNKSPQLNFQDSLDYCSEARNECLENLDSSCGKSAIGLVKRADDLNIMQQYEEAIQNYKRAISIRKNFEKNFSSDDVEDSEQRSLGWRVVAVCLHRIGDCLLEQKRFSDATTYYEKAIMEKVEQEEIGANLVKCFNGIGNCLSGMEKHDEAKSVFENAKTVEVIFEKATSKRQLAEGAVWIGNSFYEKHKIKIALKYCEDALAIMKEISSKDSDDDDDDNDGDDGLNWEFLYRQTGLCLFKFKKYDEANIVFKKSMNLRKNEPSLPDRLLFRLHHLHPAPPLHRLPPASVLSSLPF